MMYDPRATMERVKDVIQRAGKGAWLVGYDINGIKALVAASSRPITMHGASETIRKFDAEQRCQPLWIFSGGGRGYELATSQKAAEDRIKKLHPEFATDTVTGVVAVAAVPYDDSASRVSLAWLRRKLENAKEAAPRPGGKIAGTKDRQCEDCHTLVAEFSSHSAPDARRVCARCNKFIQCVRGGDISKSLKYYAKDRRLAAVSADGNNMGGFFGALDTLGQTAAASEAIAHIFESAHEQAAKGKKVLAPVTGGDDIRAFMAPDIVLDYVEKLARGVEEGIDNAEGLIAVLSKSARATFSRIGIGIGAVVAGDHYPAAQLLKHAHELEKQAKAACRGTNGFRSAFDFTVLTSETTAGAHGKDSALSMKQTSWDASLANARALQNVPSTQRMLLVERFTSPSPEEFYNRFRYQVARSPKWQKWFASCNISWKNPDALRKHVEETRFDLIDLL